MTRNTLNHKVKVGLVQINNSFSGQNYLPLTVGMLQAYAQHFLKDPENFEFMLPIFKRIPIEAAVHNLLEADVVFVSTYVWNIRISLEIARRLKIRKPSVVIVFGGPQVPERDLEFIKKHSFIDLVCHGEGEQVAVAILENFVTKNWSNVPSVVYLDDKGDVIANAKIGRVKDLASFPSPYLLGVFDPLMIANPSEKWIALWETNRGCPFACTFCDWGSAVASKVYSFDLDRLYGEMDWFAQHQIEYIFCCDANFGILSRDVDIAEYAAETKRKYGYPQALSVQATKNATERAYKTQKILADVGLNKGVDIALQSMDPMTLKSIKRGNISTVTYQELQRRFTNDNIDTYTDLILGLPGESYESFAGAVSTIIQNGQHNRIQFNNLSVLPNAEMGDPEYQKTYGLKTVVTKVVNIHGSLDDEEEVYEEQELVIATSSMPSADWIRTRAFSWMAALLYFDKILQIPLTIVHGSTGVDYRHLFELFCAADRTAYPVSASIAKFFHKEAESIQGGGAEYVQSKEWLNIWWPADEYILIKLVVENSLEAFYQEAESLLMQFIQSRNIDFTESLLQDAILLNQSLIKKPFQDSDLDIDLSYNIWDFYRAVLRGKPIGLECGPATYHVDRTSQTWSTWDAWFREVVWWGNKRGAYLYGMRASTTELAGHC